MGVAVGKAKADSGARPRQPRLPLETRRRQVLDAALAVIVEQGYAAATMEAIARRADVAKPVLYNAYKSRGELLYALLERERKRATAALAGGFADLSPATTEATIVTWLELFTRVVIENPQSWRLILSPPDGTPDEVRAHYRTGREQALRALQVLLKPVVPTGVSGKAPDVELIAHALLAIAEQCARLLIDAPDDYPPERVLGFAKAGVRSMRLPR